MVKEWCACGSRKVTEIHMGTLILSKASTSVLVRVPNFPLMVKE